MDSNLRFWQSRLKPNSLTNFGKNCSKIIAKGLPQNVRLRQIHTSILRNEEGIFCQVPLAKTDAFSVALSSIAPSIVGITPLPMANQYFSNAMGQRITAIPKAVVTASVSMAQKVVPTGTTPANVDSTGVHSVVDLTMHNLAMPSSILTIRTPLNAEGWHHALSGAGLLSEFGDIVHGIRCGFNMGIKSIISESYTPPNHSSARLNPVIIENHIKNELSEG